MTTEAELIAKAKRAALAFGMSKSEADAEVARVRAAGSRLSVNAPSQRGAILTADAYRQREYARMNAVLKDIEQSDEWKIAYLQTTVRVISTGKSVASVPIQTMQYRQPTSVPETFEREATERINNAYNARVQIARIMNPR